MFVCPINKANVRTFLGSVWLDIDVRVVPEGEMFLSNDFDAAICKALVFSTWKVQW